MSDADTIITPPITVIAANAPYGQAWRLDIEATGEDHRRGDFIETHRPDAGEGHIGTRLTMQADYNARRDAAAEAGWVRFMALANARNLELAARRAESGHEPATGDGQ